MSKNQFIFFLSLAFALQCDVAAAQNLTRNKALSNDTSYIQKINGYFVAKLSLRNDINGFDIKNTTHYTLLPNDKNIINLALSYRWLSVSASAAPKFLPGNNDDDLKGKTASSSYAFNLNFSHWLQSFSYTHVRGFYLSNTADFVQPWQKGTDPYLQIPDLVYTSFNGQTAYSFNKKFSFNSLTTQTEKQLKSTGTFMPALSYNYYIINDKTQLTGSNSSQKSNNFEALLSLSYYYNFIFCKDFYISAGITPGIGLITSKLLTRQPEGKDASHYTSTLFRLENSAALGYNAERFFAGAILIASAEGYNQSKTSNVITSDHLTFRLFAGYRFNAPSLLKKALDKADRKISSVLQ